MCLLALCQDVAAGALLAGGLLYTRSLSLTRSVSRSLSRQGEPALTPFVLLLMRARPASLLY